MQTGALEECRLGSGGVLAERHAGPAFTLLSRREPDVLVAIPNESVETCIGENRLGSTAIRSGRNAGQEARLATPRQEGLQRHRIEHVAQMMGRHIGIGQGTVRGQAKRMVKPFRPALVPKHLVRKARQLRPEPERAFPGSDPGGTAAQRRGAEALFEGSAMRCQGQHRRLGP